MKTIGQILKDARVSKNYSLGYIERVTKIKRSFVEAIEEENWEGLPAFPTILGFVKSLAILLEIDDKMAVAVLKRDYPPKKLNISPKPDMIRKFSWSPKLTFIFGTAAILIVVFGYLAFQYSQFISPPYLNVDSPKEDQVINGKSVIVFGSTELDAKITVNNQPVLIDENGKFSVSIAVTFETHEIMIKAISRSGKTTTISRKIIVQ